MAENKEQPPSVRVRDLISAYESRTNASIRVEHLRPRAKSLGNILGKNVVVRTNEVATLEDVETELDKFRVNLSKYTVYSKEKHVELQNQVFNILTSIGNIKSNDDDDLIKRKNLTTITLGMVSSLNQKLPSNNAPTERNMNKYVPYDEFKEKSRKNQLERGQEQPSQNQILTTSEFSNFDLSDSEKIISDKSETSVKKLRKHFQSENEILPIPVSQNEKTQSQKEEYKTEHSLTLVSNDEQGVKDLDAETDTPDAVVEHTYQKKTEKETNLSVFKLRVLYEKKSEESSRGLSLIFKNDTSENHRFRYKVDIPYLEKQEKVNNFSNTSGYDRDNIENDDNSAPSLTDSNYMTAYSSIDGYESDSEKDSETNSGTSSLESTGSVREVFSTEMTPVEDS
ncbi:uncharacterized protein [Leptinotarsa decemlineata]|uniref:uncharacterized protein n=1 Tax=Leptinotarsa decemlineata TaxID=7539 RepID=UPI003D304518